MPRSLPAILDFLSPISLVPGMGPKRHAAFIEAGVVTIGDLLYRFPRRYLDRSMVVPVKDLAAVVDQVCTVQGEIESLFLERGKKQKLRARLTDATGTMELLFFQGVTFYRQSIKPKQQVVVTGKVTRFGSYQMVHPEIEQVAMGQSGAAIPVLPRYSLTSEMREAGAGQRFMVKTVKWVLDNLKHYPSTLPGYFENKKHYPPLETCMRELHLPSSLEELDKFRERIKYEELYKLAFSMMLSRKKFLLPGRALEVGDYYKRFVATLPFVLTDEQSRAAKMLLGSIALPDRMHCLLQGDVGSGKTVVAFCAALPALRAGLQVVWMAPTEILARQTWSKVNQWLGMFNIVAECFTAELRSTGEYVSVKRRIATGECRFVVGTHALIESPVAFSKVGVFVVDEQHRFGAEQRLRLQEKDEKADFLLVSATPIPQSLAQTVYGDLDLVTIRSLPHGRIPVATYIVANDKRSDMEQFIAKQLENKSQYYHVVSRIESDEDEDGGTDEIVDVEAAYVKVTSGALRTFKAGFLHGRLSSSEKQAVVDAFYKKEIAVLVATTVIEVGIDVPSATVMVVENSDRFGLAQLHQLRGRVGRGNEKSYCFLMCSPMVQPEALARLKAFCKESDGFAVAELDLKNRGPGEVNGFRQAGKDGLLVADILQDAHLYEEIVVDIKQQFRVF